jgi:zinc transport system permease protein
MGFPVSVFTASYIHRAALACGLVGLVAPAVGIFVVQRRLSLLGDGIGHVAFAGAAVGALTGAAPVATAGVAAVGGGLAVEWLRARGRAQSDVALAVIFYGGISAGVLFASLARTPASGLVGFLFGSVLTVTGAELVGIGALALVVVGVMSAFRNAFFGVCYDEELARVSGLPVRALNFAIATAAAATIAIAMRVVGVLLIAALMILPVAIAQRLTRSFTAAYLTSLAVGVVVSVAGLGVAVAIDAAPGATIVVTAVVVLLIVVLADLLRVRRSGTRQRAARRPTSTTV